VQIAIPAFLQGLLFSLPRNVLLASTEAFAKAHVLGPGKTHG